MLNYAVLGDPPMSGLLRCALQNKNLGCCDSAELEIQEYWQTLKWFATASPAGTFISVGLNGQTSVRNLLFMLVGSLNVIQAATGFSQRLILITQFPSMEFAILHRLIHLYHVEKGLDFYSIVRQAETPELFAERCVACMQTISASELDARREAKAQSGTL